MLRDSTGDNERLAALRAVDRILTRAKADWGDVVKMIEGPELAQSGRATRTGHTAWTAAQSYDPDTEFESGGQRFRTGPAPKHPAGRVDCGLLLVTLRLILGRRPLRDWNERTQQFLAGMMARCSRGGRSQTKISSKQDAWLRGLAAEVGVNLPWNAPT